MGRLRPVSILLLPPEINNKRDAATVLDSISCNKTHIDISLTSHSQGFNEEKL